MNNLIIIGNGFDLAHGLKTNYSDFIEWLFLGKSIDKNRFSDLLVTNSVGNSIRKVEIDVDNNKLTFYTKNILFSTFAYNAHNKNWGGIEKEYFDTVNRSTQPNMGIATSYGIEAINQDFEVIKKYLEEYLTKIVKEKPQKQIFNHFLNRLGGRNSLFLSFNYTKILEDVYPKFINHSSVINIHGELSNSLNPIIFGYAADYDESSSLLDLNNKHHVKNIKRYNYKETLNFKKTEEWLNKSKEVFVHILGHSCGLSDKLILSEIFNHKKVKAIYIHYYENSENFKDTLINIDRIVREPNIFKKIASYKTSCRIPQYNDTGNADSILENQIYHLIDDIQSKQKSGPELR